MEFVTCLTFGFGSSAAVRSRCLTICQPFTGLSGSRNMPVFDGLTNLVSILSLIHHSFNDGVSISPCNWMHGEGFFFKMV